MGQFECLENYVFCVKNTHLLVEMLEDFQTWHHHSDFKINGTYLGFFSTQHHPRNDKCLTSKKAKLHATTFLKISKVWKKAVFYAQRLSSKDPLPHLLLHWPTNF